MPGQDHDRGVPVSRRGLLKATAGLAAGAGAAAARSPLLSSAERPGWAGLEATVPFYGRRQAGITTPPQRCTSFASFDVTAPRRRQLVALLRRWTAVAAALCAGRPASPLTSRPHGVEEDGGSAIGLGPARLTVNIGFGPSLFGIGGPDRYGLRSRWPMALVELPSFPGDQIPPSSAGGDLTVHACAEDPQVAFHAVRQLARSAGGDAVIRWAQSGFNEAPAVDGTPRNLMGFKDGTLNPSTDDELGQFVWVGPGQDQEWMAGGTYLVVRRIRMLLDSWDAQPLASQEGVIGRHKFSGAPLGARGEFDPLDLKRRGADGQPLIARDAHVRLAAPVENWGQMLLRRSYAYDNGVQPSGAGPSGPTLDAGLLFCAYQQNPRLAFIPIYANLAARDALREFTVHTASAVAAVPPGASGPGHWVGEELLG